MNKLIVSYEGVKIEIEQEEPIGKDIIEGALEALSKYSKPVGITWPVTPQPIQPWNPLNPPYRVTSGLSTVAGVTEKSAYPWTINYEDALAIANGTAKSSGI